MNDKDLIFLDDSLTEEEKILELERLIAEINEEVNSRK